MSDISLNFSNADFDAIKNDLKTFLTSQTEFRDFNFDGSASSLLLSALAYTANYMAVHANMALSEVFLDSCQLRSSAVSAARDLGYFPAQVSASRARVTVTYTPSPLHVGRTDIILPEGTRFAAGDSDTSYEFVTTKSLQMLEETDLDGVVINPGTYTCTVDIYQGSIRQRAYTVPADTGVPIYLVPETDLDTNYFRVYVTHTGDMDPTEYFRATEYVTVDDETNAFFLQEGIDEAIEFYFGDGTIGFKPPISSAILVKYLTSVGEPANGIGDFSIVTSLDSIDGPIAPNLVSVETDTISAYGAPKQDLEGIKFTAPKAYAAQNRCVTEGDYQSMLMREFSFIETISVYGGENADPPQYGRVLVSIKPVDGTELSPEIKADIKERVLDRFSVVGIIPEIIDPDYTFVELSSVVTYDKERAFTTESDIVRAVETAAEDYFRTAVTKFNSVFRFSNLVAVIDESDRSILGNRTTFTLGKQIRPIPNAPRQYVFKYGNAIVPGSIQSVPVLTSSGLSLEISDRDGPLKSYLNGVVAQTNIGTVDYSAGIVTLSNFTFEVPVNTTFNLKARSVSMDVVAQRNNLIVLDAVRVELRRYFRNAESGAPSS